MLSSQTEPGGTRLQPFITAQLSSPGRSQLFSSGVSFAGTGEQKHCKINIKTEQGSCDFFVPVSRERASPAELSDAYE